MIKGLDKLTFLSDDDRKYIETAAKLYKKNACVIFRIHEYNEEKKSLTIKVWQERNLQNKYLSVKELRDRIFTLFEMVKNDIKLHVHAREFMSNGIVDIDKSWIKEKISEHNLKQADLVAMLNINKSTISTWINGKAELTNIHKAMFFYFFKELERS